MRLSPAKPESNSNLDLPEPKVQRSHWPFPWVWLVPLLAMVGAGYYGYRLFERHGTEITINFPDTTGVRDGATPLVIHGVKVGTVTEVDLSKDETHSVVHVRLQRKADPIAREHTVFWLVRPAISGGNIIGLGTIVTGPYIEALPGLGNQVRDFQGIQNPPTMQGPGIRVILHAARIEHSQLNSPVYYRGIQVGTVQDIRLSSDATQVSMTLFIWQRYQKLLRSTSQFWPVRDVEIQGDLLGGLTVHLGSLRTALGGGIAFATPDTGAPATDGMKFNLQDHAKPAWLLWTPQIDFSQPSGTKESQNILRQQSGLRSTIRVK